VKDAQNHKTFTVVKDAQNHIQVESCSLQDFPGLQSYPGHFEDFDDIESILSLKPEKLQFN
jgi:hypothetical protein